MPIEISWLNDDKSIMLHRYVDSLRLDELITHFDTVYEMINTLDHIVDIIADVREMGYPPTGLMSSGLRYYRNKRHAKQGIQVIVGQTFLLSFMKGITTAASTFIPQAKQVRFMDTVPEAIQYIHTYRATRAG